MTTVNSNQITTSFSTSSNLQFTNTLSTNSDISNRLNTTSIVNTVVNNTPINNSVGIQGLPGPKGEKGDSGEFDNISGYDIQLSTLNNGDLLLFENGLWINKNKTTISDGGNF